MPSISRGPADRSLTPGSRTSRSLTPRSLTPRPTFLDTAIDKAVSVPSATVHAHVDAVRRRNPEATPEQVVVLLEREYLRVIAAAGGVVGAAAAAPVIGTGLSMTLTVSDVATFFAASAAFTLAVASVHGIEVEDSPRRRALLLATILGDSGAAAVGEAAEIGSLTFARTLLTRVPTTTVKRVNKILTRRLVRKQVGRQSALALGRLAPFGVGAAIGVMGARALGRTVIDGARAAFGAAPATFPQTIEVVQEGGATRVVRAASATDD